MNLRPAVSALSAMVVLLPAVGLAQEPLGAEALRSAQYARLLVAAVKKRLVVPPLDGVRRDRLRAVMLVRVGPKGELLEVTFVSPSGHMPFDEHALRAVKEASPFPLPPEQLRDEAQKKGVAIVLTP